MSFVSTWLLSIAGIVIISVLLELVLPDGQMNKYIKSIFAFIIIFIVVMPLPKLLNKEISLDRVFQTENITFQEDCIYQININKLSAIKNDLSSNLAEAGYLNVDISLSANVMQENLEINKVFVDLSNMVISEDAEHKDILQVKAFVVEVIEDMNIVNGEEVVFE